MGDPDYVYRPLTDEQRAKLSRAQRKRLGIPDGYCRVYGLNVPEEIAPEVRAAAQDAARRGDQSIRKIVAAALVEAVKRRGWKVPEKHAESRKSQGMSAAYECTDVTLPTTVRG